MILWQYKETEIKVLDIEKGLNILGKDGWELAHIQIFPNVYRVLLKRHMTTQSFLGVD